MSVPAGTSHLAPDSSDTNTVLISGWRANQPGTLRLRSMQSDRRGSLSTRVAVEKGQPESAIDSPRQRLAFATPSSAARQWAAWLSPSSATVAAAPALGTPNWQTRSGPSASTIVQGALGRSRAAFGVGTTWYFRA